MAKSSYFLPAADAGFGAFFGNFCNQGAWKAGLGMPSGFGRSGVGCNAAGRLGACRAEAHCSAVRASALYGGANHHFLYG
jgi:hypothetical protein